jgi:hypothetical protein
VYGEANKNLQSTCRELNLPLHTFAWSGAAEGAGLERNALYLVRPDGYIALASSDDDARDLRAFAEEFQLRFKDLRSASR